MPRTGGWGQSPVGQSEWGNGQSVIEPRFNLSTPLDGAHNVSRERWLEFEIYYYSSFPNLYDPAVLAEPFIQVSEDAGIVYADASLAPYALTVRYIGGHTVWCKIVKTGLWTPNTEIVIKTTLPDEFGQVITKDFPERWS